MKLLARNEKEKIPPITRALDDVQDMAARLHARTIATKQAVRSCTERCIREIEERCKNLLSNIDHLYREKSDVLHKQQEVLQGKIKFKILTTFTCYVVPHCSESKSIVILLVENDVSYKTGRQNIFILFQNDTELCVKMV